MKAQLKSTGQEIFPIESLCTGKKHPYPRGYLRFLVKDPISGKNHIQTIHKSKVKVL